MFSIIFVVLKGIDIRTNKQNFIYIFFKLKKIEDSKKELKRMEIELEMQESSTAAK